MKPGYVPSAGELTAHVRTGVDGAVRWLDRTVASPAGDPELWDQSSFYARMMLMRSLERGELLGWALQRDSLAEPDADRGVRVRQITSYWSEARPGLHEALQVLRRAADLDPHTRSARDAMNDARFQLDEARGWLASMADGLAANSRTVIEPDRGREMPRPDEAYGLDRL